MFNKKLIYNIVLLVFVGFPLVLFAQQSYPDGTLLRPVNYAGVYVFDKETVRVIPSIEVFESYNYDWNDVQEVDYVVHNRYPETRLVKTSDSPKVYYLTLSRDRLWIPTVEVFVGAGYNSVSEEVTVINDLEMSYYEDERFVKSDQYGKITAYRLSSFGTKRAIKSPEIFESYTSAWGDIQEIPDRILTIYPETKLIRQIGGHKVYFIENGMRRWVSSPQDFEQRGFSWGEIEDITEIDLQSYPEGDIINFEERSRDNRRISDMRQVALALEMYYDDNISVGYPGIAGSNQWGILETALEAYMVTMPSDPKAGIYEYWVAADNQSYVLNVTLEDNNNSELDDDLDGFQLSCDCTDPEYCLMP